ncbi:hypothetical protein OH797_31880 [Streptomyces anulatus]|uniref:hypothetical protein n=1 Tax=Streptomyces TaxID=1883 RepID=UPI0036A857B2
MPAAAKKTAAPKTAAAAAEAKKGFVTFEHVGLTFEIPGDPDRMPLELLEAEDELEAVKIVLGAEQWAEFKSARPTIGDFRELSRKVNEASAGSGN